MAVVYEEHPLSAAIRSLQPLLLQYYTTERGYQREEEAADRTFQYQQQ